MNPIEIEPRKETGASAVEYALLLAGIAGVLIIVIFALGGPTLSMFGDSCDKLKDQMSTGSCARN